MNLDRNRISDEKNTIIVDNIRKSGHMLEKKVVKFLFSFYSKDFSKVHSDYGTRHMKFAFGRKKKEEDYKKLKLNDKKASWILCKITTQNYNYYGHHVGSEQHYQCFQIDKNNNIHFYIGGREGRQKASGLNSFYRNTIIQNSKDYDQSLLVY